MIIFEDSYLQKKKPPVVHIYFFSISQQETIVERLF